MAFQRPGVYVQETLVQTAPSVLPTSTVAAFVGVTARGPLTPTYVGSWTQFQRIYGGFAGANQDLAHAVYQFFNNGGANAYIVRVAGAGKALATRQLLDRTGAEGNAADPVLRVDAANEGVWGNQIYVEVPAAGAVAGRFDLNVYYGGTSNQHLVERWTDLSMEPTDGRFAPSVVNSPVNGSVFIRIADLVNRAAPFDPLTQIPLASEDPGGDVLATGADGGVPSDQNMIDGLSTLSAVDAYLTINLPGVSDSDLINQAISWVEARGTAFLVVDPAPDITPAQAITALGDVNRSPYAAMYYPRVVVSDPSNAVPGSTRLIAPGGLVVGQFAASDSTRGIHRAPAGTTTRLNGVVALNQRAMDTELDALNTAGINAIRQIPGVGFCIFGARTLKLNQIDKYIGPRRTLTSTRMALQAVTRFAIFEPNNEMLWARIREQCNRVLTQLWQEGAFRGTSPGEGFYVKCDAENNPQSSIDSGEVHIEVGVALNTPAEFIVLRIGQFEAGTSVTEEV